MRLLKLVPDNTNFHFLKWRVPFFAVSGLLVIASWVMVFVNGLNLGVDFIGGQMIRVSFAQGTEAPVAQLRGEVEKLGYGEPTIQRFGQPNQVSIRLKLPEGAEADAGIANAIPPNETMLIAAKAPARNFLDLLICF